MNHGASQTFTISPYTGYRVTNVWVDGVSVGARTSYTFTNVSSDHTISATFSRQTYTITATAGTGGSISPSGSVSVLHGDDQSFRITPNSGYRIANVYVNGMAVGPTTNHTCTNVHVDQTITATFERIPVATYTITAGTANYGGSISPAGSVKVTQGADQQFTITPLTGYRVTDVKVDGVSVGARTLYTFTNVSDDHAINATFARLAYTITASAGSGGSISPVGSVTAYYGSSQTFAITPASGYRIADVTVDGVSVGAVASYQFSNIRADHTIAATFESDAGCFSNLPDPVLTLKGTEEYEVDGTQFTRYQLEVANSSDFPDALFEPAPHLPACGLNENSSRTWIHIYDNTGRRLYGFCGASSSSDILKSLWFSVRLGATPPEAVYITLVDRECQQTYTSNHVRLNTEVRYELPQAGWHLVSLPVTPDDTRVSSLFPTAVNGIAYAWNPAGSNYAQVTSMEPGKGYWIYLTGAATATISGTPLDTYTRTYQRGWNLIGSVAGGADFANPADTPDRSVYSPAFGWNPSARRYDTTTRFEAEHGYWVAVLQNGAVLTVGGNTPATGGSVSNSGPALGNHDFAVDLQLTPDTTGETPKTVTFAGHSSSSAGYDEYDGLSGPVPPGGYYAYFGINEFPNYLTTDSRAYPAQAPQAWTLRITNADNARTAITWNPADLPAITGSTFTMTGVSEGSVDMRTATSATVVGNATVTITGTVTQTAAYTITASAGVGGSVSPSGQVAVEAHGTQSFIITPETGYQIEDVLVDGSSIGSVTGYTFTDVVGDHTIDARFSPVSASGGSYFGFDEFGGLWQDVDKSLQNQDDDWLCWAAAASNILEWAGWNVFESLPNAFTTFQDYWSDAAGLMEYGWQWWFDGTEPEPESGWAEVDTTGGGGYWSDYNFFEYFYEDWAWDAVNGQWNDGAELMSTVDEYLHDGYGTTLAVYNDGGGHALTAWGYEYDAAGNYTGIYVTDSDDYNTNLKLLSVSLVDDLWFLDAENQYGYSDWFIGGVQALDRHPGSAVVPEPGSLLLLGLGLLGLLSRRFRRK